MGLAFRSEIKNNNVLEKFFLLAMFFFTFQSAMRNIFLGLLFIAYLITKLYYKEFKITSSEFNKYVVIFFIFSLLSLFRADNLARGLDALISPIFRYVAFYFMALELIKLEKVKKYINIIFASKLLMMIYGYYMDYFTDNDFFRGSNARAAFAGFMVFFALTLLFTQKSSIYKNLLYVIGFLLGIMALPIQSRGAVVGFAVGICIWIVLMFYKEFDWKKLTVIIVLIALISVPILNSERLMRDFDRLRNYQDTLSTRLNMWKVSIDLIKENPVLGVGIGNFKPAAFEQAEKIMGEVPWSSRHRHPHNLYLQIAMEQGIISLIIFLIIIFKAYKISFSNYRNFKMGEWGYFVAIAFIAMSIALLTQSLVSFVTKRSYNGITLIILFILNYKFYYANLLGRSDN
ncbi:O-antigen ligase family protein [Fuchsiella alkaliacetigena]|uniref:O-antigen ligase family protein n=1 Tax=Fuchsiella alkaliacetigena TaxID=957042 RepID=UPI00200B017D|nr:O-antigen ligase family protein [Fuchsiella alkaliacetigena]MCK8824299.1 O-antigen ligase family protein [Fuchsiella alkaliacetigena]